MSVADVLRHAQKLLDKGWVRPGIARAKREDGSDCLPEDEGAHWFTVEGALFEAARRHPVEELNAAWDALKGVVAPGWVAYDAFVMGLPRDDEDRPIISDDAMRLGISYAKGVGETPDLEEWLADPKRHHQEVLAAFDLAIACSEAS